MEWKGRRKSTNVEDRRGSRKGPALAGGGIGGLLILIIIAFLGGDPLAFLSDMGTGTVDEAVPYEETAEERELTEFVSVVLADTEEVWTDIFEDNGVTYEKPTLVLFTDQVHSACGTASSAVGPFYCPGDQKLYIDLSFFDELKTRFNVPGEFAMAYVIAHEVGHHVQTLLGTSQKVQAIQAQVSEKEANQYSVRLELQADYYAGVWAHHEEKLNLLEEGDIEEAMTAASAIGDDRLQMQARGYVIPDSFTHGTSEQRQKWFMKGFKAGTIQDGNTFEALDL